MYFGSGPFDNSGENHAEAVSGVVRELLQVPIR